MSRRAVYRYRNRLRDADQALAVLGRKRGWKPAASRLSAEQEQAITDAIRRLRKKPGPVRVIDLVEEVAVRCRLLEIPCPSRSTNDRRLKRLTGVKVHRRGVAPTGNVDPRISPGPSVVQRSLDVVQIDHTPMDMGPRERPHHGGHIEHVIGTKMSKLKALPGATGRSPKARQSFDPDKPAALTLGALEAWSAQQIVGRYHHEAHRGFEGGTPAAAWALAPAPRLPAGSLKRFRIAFLPAITRTLHRSGIAFEHLRYWHPVFAPWLNRHEALTLHFDPRDLSRLYVAHDDDFLDVPLADLRTPAVSVREVQAATRHLREAGRQAINQPMLIEAIDGQREIDRVAQASTRKLRRKKQIDVRRTSVAIDPLNPAPATTSGSNIDWSKPPVPFDGEAWHRRR